MKRLDQDECEFLRKEWTKTKDFGLWREIKNHLGWNNDHVIFPGMKRLDQDERESLWKIVKVKTKEITDFCGSCFTII